MSKSLAVASNHPLSSGENSCHNIITTKIPVLPLHTRRDDATVGIWWLVKEAGKENKLPVKQPWNFDRTLIFHPPKQETTTSTDAQFPVLLLFLLLVMKNSPALLLARIMRYSIRMERPTDRPAEEWRWNSGLWEYGEREELASATYYIR